MTQSGSGDSCTCIKEENPYNPNAAGGNTNPNASEYDDKCDTEESSKLKSEDPDCNGIDGDQTNSSSKDLGDSCSSVSDCGNGTASANVVCQVRSDSDGTKPASGSKVCCIPFGPNAAGVTSSREEGFCCDGDKAFDSANKTCNDSTATACGHQGGTCCSKAANQSVDPCPSPQATSKQLGCNTQTNKCELCGGNNQACCLGSTPCTGSGYSCHSQTNVCTSGGVAPTGTTNPNTTSANGTLPTATSQSDCSKHQSCGDCVNTTSVCGWCEGATTGSKCMPFDAATRKPSNASCQYDPNKPGNFVVWETYCSTASVAGAATANVPAGCGNGGGCGGGMTGLNCPFNCSLETNQDYYASRPNYITTVNPNVAALTVPDLSCSSGKLSIVRATPNGTKYLFATECNKLMTNGKCEGNHCVPAN